MQIRIVDEAYNLVDWRVRTPLLKILLGILVAVTVLTALVLPSPVRARWPVLAVAGAVALVVALVLVLTTPLGEQGHLERTPEGGEIYRMRRWLLAGKRVAWQAPLEEISGFQMEWQTFEETAAHTYTLARLWAVLTDSSFVSLTDWAEPDDVRILGESLAKAGRRVFEAGDV